MNSHEVSSDVAKWNKIQNSRSGFSSEALGYYRGCPVCGGMEKSLLLSMTDFQFYTDCAYEPKRFDVRQNVCQDCFALYLDPCYSDYGFNILFSEAGKSYGSTDAHTQEQIQWLMQKRLIKDGSILLDVGCYEGSFLSQLPDTIRKLGVDIDEPAIKRGMQRYASQAIRFYHGDFESFEFHDDSPDTITMYHVLEHLPRPVPVLEKLRRISHSSTRLVVEVPVLERGNTNDICGGFFSIQHTTHFSEHSLLNCLMRAGWKIVESHETTDYNGFRVVAIPFDFQDGPAIQGNPEDWVAMRSSLASLQSSILDVEKTIQKIPESERMVIWGGGAHIEFLHQFTTLFHSRRDTEFVIVDSDALKQSKTWRGIKICDPGILKAPACQDLPLIISSYGGQDEIAEAALKLGVRNELIFKLYDRIVRY